jgi:hypothetical protein
MSSEAQRRIQMLKVKTEPELAPVPQSQTKQISFADNQDLDSFVNSSEKKQTDSKKNKITKLTPGKFTAAK